MKADVYNKEGKKTGDITLPESVFSLAWNPDLLHEVVVAYQSNARPTVAHTKDRSDVRGGGIKPWRQKGTGRARHGSIRSPIWRGGGTTFGPRSEKDYSKKVNKKARAKALGVALTRKLTDGEVIFLEDFALEAPQTKSAILALTKLGSVVNKPSLLSKKNNAVLVLVSGHNSTVSKSFANINNVALNLASDVNALDVMQYKYVVVVDPKESVEVLRSRLDFMKSAKPEASASAKKSAKSTKDKKEEVKA